MLVITLNTSFIHPKFPQKRVSSAYHISLSISDLPLGSDVFDNSGITSSSNISTVSSFSEENSPIFQHRSKRKEVSFVELQPVASSSLRCVRVCVSVCPCPPLCIYITLHFNLYTCPPSSSPLQDIMNTPKFQVRKLQQQMMKERDYRDGLERELSSKLSVIAQKGNRLYTFSTSVLHLTCIPYIYFYVPHFCIYCI